MAASQRPTALVPTNSRVQLDSRREARSIRSTQKHWHPPEGLSPDDVKSVIDAAKCERDRLLLRFLWATGARVSEALALRPMDVQRDHLVPPNRKSVCCEPVITEPSASRRLLARNIPAFKMPAVDRPSLVEADQRSPPGSLCCFSLSVSRSPRAYHKVAACVLEIAIRIRVSRSADDLASLVPRNVMRILPMFSSL